MDVEPKHVVQGILVAVAAWVFLSISVGTALAFLGWITREKCVVEDEHWHIYALCDEHVHGFKDDEIFDCLGCIVAECDGYMP